MNDNEKKSFIRWQDRSTEQLGFVNNLLVFLAAGILAFQSQLAISNKVFGCFDRCLIIISILLIFISLVTGCKLAWNRLQSFRNTMRISRKKQHGESSGLEELRKHVEILDKKTWFFLKAQTILFTLGALFLVIFAIRQFIR